MFAETPHGFSQTFRSLAAYEASWMWRNSKTRYRLSGAPVECFICGSPHFELHHRSYMYVGSERPSELVALCGDHHCLVERLVRERLAKKWDAHLVLRAEIVSRAGGELRRLTHLDRESWRAAA